MSAQKSRRIGVRITRRNLKNELKDQVSNHKSGVRHLTAEDIRFRVKFYGQLSGESWSPVSRRPFLPGFFYWNEKGQKAKVSLN